MENKKLGFVVLSISVLASILAFGFLNVLGRQTNALQCYPTNECQRIESLLGLSHIAVGLISFIGALGIYLLFFSTSEEAILKRLEELKINPFPQGVVRVKGYQEPIFRIRIGKYRALYFVDNKTLTVYIIKIDKRGNVYE